MMTTMMIVITTTMVTMMVVVVVVEGMKYSYWSWRQYQVNLSVANKRCFRKVISSCILHIFKCSPLFITGTETRPFIKCTFINIVPETLTLQTKSEQACKRTFWKLTLIDSSCLWNFPFFGGGEAAGIHTAAAMLDNSLERFKQKIVSSSLT